MKWQWNGWKKSFWIGKLLIKVLIAKSGSWSTKEQDSKYERIYILHAGILRSETGLKALSIIIGPLSIMTGFAIEGE